MKMVKKIAALVIIGVMTAAMAVTVFAASDGKITIDNAINGEKYNLYKVFDLTYKAPGETNATGTTSTGAVAGVYEGVAYTYTASGASDQFAAAIKASTSPFDVKLVAGSTTKYTVVRKSDATDTAIIDFVKANISKLPDDRHVAEDTVAAGGKVEWSGLEYGYYYATSTTGAFVTIDSTIKEVTVKEKNTLPSQDKKQAVGTSAPDKAAGYADAEQQAQVGDKVWYQIEVKNGKGTDKDIIVTDTMTDGLTFNNDITVFKSQYDAASGTYGDEASVSGSAATWTLADKTASDTWTFRLTFDDEYVKTLKENDKLFIRFSATVNTKTASDSDASKETNTSVMAYSNQTFTDSVDVVTYKFQLDKTDEKYKDLLGAKFELYRSSVADANKVKFTNGTAESGIPVLIVDPAGTITEIDLTEDGLNSAKVIIKGLDKDQYVLHETKAPDGYNAADDKNVPDTVLVLINGTITDAEQTTTGDIGVVTVVNETGTELPSTGGIGTTILYIIGGALVVICGVLLVAKKRSSNK